jgi:NADP-dependent 3-hydroxy acid dehydrogenase YdfG
VTSRGPIASTGSSDFKDAWMTAAANTPAVHAFVRKVRQELADRDIETWGFDPEEIDAQLARVDGRT